MLGDTRQSPSRTVTEANTFSCLDDAAPPAENEEENNKDEQRIEGINLRDSGVGPEGPSESKKQPGTHRWSQNKQVVDLNISVDLFRQGLSPFSIQALILF